MLRSEFHTAPLGRFCLVSTVWKPVCWQTGDQNAVLTAVIRTAGKQRNFICTTETFHLHNRDTSSAQSSHKPSEHQTQEVLVSNRLWGQQELATLQVLTVVLLRMQVLGLWHLVTWRVAQNCLTLQMKAHQFFKTSGKTNPMSQGYIPHDQTAQQCTAKTSHLTGLHRQLQP